MAGPAQNKVKVVSAYVNLELTKRPSAEFHVLGDRLVDAVGDRLRVFKNFPFHDCWAFREFGFAYPAANVRAEDRFATDAEHLRSNLVQHSPMQWVAWAAREDPEPDVFVWIGYSIFKQGAFTGKPVREEHIADFLGAVEDYPFDDIPFPGITPRSLVLPHGDNWRFCGSTIIVPRRFLSAIEWSYKFNLREFVRRHQCVPLDLAIWPSVEDNSGLPWRFYQAEYDHTQFTNFSGSAG